MLQLWQLKSEAYPLLGGLLHVASHVHVNLTQAVDNVMWSVLRSARLAHPYPVHIEYHLNQDWITHCHALRIGRTEGMSVALPELEHAGAQWPRLAVFTVEWH